MRFISRLLYQKDDFHTFWRPIVHRRHRPHYMLTSVGCPYCASCRFSIICTRFIIPRTPCKLWGFVEDCGRLYNPLQDLCALVFSRCLVGNSSLLRSVCGQGNRRAPPLGGTQRFPRLFAVGWVHTSCRSSSLPVGVPKLRVRCRLRVAMLHRVLATDTKFHRPP